MSQAILLNLAAFVSHDAQHNGGAGYLTEVCKHGCQSGIVANLIYYADTTSFFVNFRAEINDLLIELIDSTGCSVAELFKEWDNMDPLALDAHNQTLLAWFAYEETARQLLED